MTKYQLTIRIIVDLLIIVSILHGWWFIAVPLALIAAFRFDYFIEMIIAGVLYDSLFGLVQGSGFLRHAGLIAAAMLFLIVGGLKMVVRK